MDSTAVDGGSWQADEPGPPSAAEAAPPNLDEGLGKMLQSSRAQGADQ